MNTLNRNTMSNVHILSRSSMPFRDRSEAGILLGHELARLKGQRTVVLGIPRGGIVVAQALAREIEADLDIILSRKLGTPGQEELAMGALAESGEVFLNRDVVDHLYIPESAIQHEKARQMEEIRRRRELIRQAYPRVNLVNRIVVVTDDGVATGATMQAAVWAVRHEKPQKLIAALPVASEEAVVRLSADVDEVVCLRMPDNFMAVGQFYYQFYQVTDEEVLNILREYKR